MKLNEYSIPAPVIDEVTTYADNKNTYADNKNTYADNKNTYADDEGKWTAPNETVRQVLSIDVDAGDILIINVEVGKMPTHKVIPYLNDIKVRFNAAFPKGLKVIYTTMRDGVKTIEFDLLKF